MLPYLLARSLFRLRGSLPVHPIVNKDALLLLCNDLLLQTIK